MSNFIYAAFANDAASPLQALSDEYNALRQVLSQGFEGEPYATYSLMHERLCQSAWRHRVLGVHYAGHASPFQLHIGAGVDAGRVEEFFRLIGPYQKSLHFVFLNGCLTGNLAQALQLHVPVVIGTLGKVSDALAQRVAQQFYSKLMQGIDLQSAFELALNEAQMPSNALMRDLHWGQEEAVAERPNVWGLFSQRPEHLQWKASFEAQPSLEQTKQALRDLVDELAFDQVFEQIRSSGLSFQKPTLRMLEMEYQSGNYRFDFASRVKTFINGLK